MERIHTLGTHMSTLLLQMPYGWIFILMTLESTFIPIPSEIIMLPAGYLASLGHFNLGIAIGTGIIGNIIGAAMLYRAGVRGGEKLSRKILGNKYHTIGVHFFHHYGDVGIFIARLIPGIRHIISFPAGVFRMSFGKFILFTGLGSTIWVSFLGLVGYFLGENEDFVKEYKYLVLAGVVVLGLIIIIVKKLLMKYRTKSQ